jgi:dihydroorotate dehydrogenase electron transfer subunit
MEPAPLTGTADSATLDRRLCEVAENRPSGGYRIVSLCDREGLEPLPGQLYVLTPATDQSEPGKAAFPPRPLPIAATTPGAGGVRLDFLVSGAGEDPLGKLAAGDRVRVTGPLGAAFAAPRELSPDAAGAVLVGADLGIAPLALLRRRLSQRGVPLRVLLGFRGAGGSGGLELFCGAGAELCPEVRLASEDVTGLLAVLLEGDDAPSAVVYSCGPPGMLETVGRLCAERGVVCELRPESSPADP